MGASVRCARRGCGKDFDPDHNEAAECTWHPGGPVFHEGTKSWSCCRDVNKPVIDFADFMAIKGCVTGSHSTEASDALPAIAPSPNATAPSSASAAAPVKTNGAGTEVYGNLASSFGATAIAAPPPAVKVPPKPKVEEQDAEDIPVPAGSKCKRTTCGAGWTGSDGAARGKGQVDECTYHPGVPIFHEGSKGYSCCKKRVLDFDDFLRLPGCKRGLHLFVGAPPADGADGEGEEELVECRMDHYQTPSQVIVSVFGKNASKDKSKVTFTSQTVTVDLVLPGNKRHLRTFSLFGPISPSQSSHRLIGPKCEITLVKADGRSWPALEEGDSSGGNVTFGVQGRTGSVGAKQAVLSEANQR